MYESFYRLRKAPFRLTPDPYFFFESRTHKRGAAYLCYAMQQGEGFVVITGEPGTGKTELMLNLIREFDDPHVVFAKIVSTNLNADDFLALVAASFELSTEGLGKGILLKKLENFFIACARQGKQVFLLIDEAHNLSTTSLAELSMLSNFQLGEKAILRCFLLGQESLGKKLEKPKLAHLKQRVIASAHLEPINEAETTEYIKYRLTQAGWLGDPRFHDNAYPLIYKFTGGIPRQINFFCNRLLLQGYIDELHKIDVDVVRGVIKELLEETTVAHAPCGPNEHFTVPLPNASTSVHQLNQPRVANTQEARASAPILKVVTNQALAIKPEFTFPATDNKAIGTALIACPTNLEDADVLQELARDGARRLLRMLTQDSQADRELRASVAFYIRAESARLMSSDSIQQLNTTIPTRPLLVETDHHISSAWKWTAIVGVAVLGVVIAPQLQHINKPAPLTDTVGNGETNRLMVATAMLAGNNSISSSDSVTTSNLLQDDNDDLTTFEIPLSKVVTETSPPTMKATEQLATERHKPLEMTKVLQQTLQQTEKKKKTEGIPMVLANSDRASARPQVEKLSPQLSKTGLPSKSQKPAEVSKSADTPVIVFPLPSRPSLTLAKSADDQPKPVMRPVIDNPVEPATTTEIETGIPAADLKVLLSRLTSAYEAGNLRKLVSVFADNARSNDKTSLNEIEDDYRKLFDVTDMRKMMISGIQWKKFRNQMRGKGSFQLVVRETGAGRVTSYDGRIEFDVAQSARGIVITQLDYRYGQ